MPKAPIKIVGINGSPFPDGNVAQHLRTALSAAEQTGAETVMIHLDPMRFPHHDGRRPEDAPFAERIGELLPDRGGLREVVVAILAADGVIFASSTQNFTATSQMLALFSWLQTNVDAPEYRLAGKVAGFMSVCEEDGGQNANAAMFNPASHLGFSMPPFCSHLYNKFARESEGDWQKTDHVLLGLNVRRLAQIFRGEILVGDWDDDRIGSW